MRRSILVVQGLFGALATEYGMRVGVQEWRRGMFDVFARLHTEAEFPGTGIGLALARKAARWMGSKITVESASGLGSWLALRPPLAPARANAAQPAEASTAGAAR